MYKSTKIFFQDQDGHLSCSIKCFNVTCQAMYNTHV